MESSFTIQAIFTTISCFRLILDSRWVEIDSSLNPIVKVATITTTAAATIAAIVLIMIIAIDLEPITAVAVVIVVTAILERMGATITKYANFVLA